MGWTFVRLTRDQVIRELTAPHNGEHIRSEIVDHTLIDYVLWSVVRVTAKRAGVRALGAILDRMPMAVSVWDRELRNAYANAQVQQRTGRSARQLPFQANSINRYGIDAAPRSAATSSGG